VVGRTFVLTAPKTAIVVVVCGSKVEVVGRAFVLTTPKTSNGVVVVAGDVLVVDILADVDVSSDVCGSKVVVVSSSTDDVEDIVEVVSSTVVASGRPPKSYKTSAGV
jgi:intracellular sulfur oxidation DsrE/DsrF family protein